MGAIGVIGGSGLYKMDGLQVLDEIRLETPFGAPSDHFIRGELHGKEMLFLPRHGRGHTVLPHEINFRANLWGMKKLGADRVISVSAVGSMKEAILPGHLVLVDQFIDRTWGRPQTFYGDGVVVHVPFADPVCPVLHAGLKHAAATLSEVTVHSRGTYVCINGPQFSTRAESLLYRSWGVDVIGMTNLPEAKLAREAELGYATIALATDFDCWHQSEDSVTVEAVLNILRSNVQKAQALISAYVRAAPESHDSPMVTTAARTSLMTPPALIPAQIRHDLAPIFDAFLPATENKP